MTDKRAVEFNSLQRQIEGEVCIDGMHVAKSRQVKPSQAKSSRENQSSPQAVPSSLAAGRAMAFPIKDEGKWPMRSTIEPFLFLF